ncbi:MAG: hypothetical protein ABS99_00340 [Acetobacteraceae bacterium SCN 69-10]|nr:MAG: hypothetical protein ABS99_00340 [Acetobacteraceae bacterium SCN 69-10]OJY76837.1 MAG: hypothetical protein BGP12_05140 [Rhodospirillales bacterium 70-18]
MTSAAYSSGLYRGVVAHRRFRPVGHRLRYRIFQLLLDIDELPGLSSRLRLFGHNRAGLVSFHDRDHLARTAEPLRAQVERLLAEAELEGGGRIQVLCMPRILGHAFNPISVWWCHDREGALTAVLYEVNNTFGQRHTYLVPARAEAGVLVQDCAKQFYVSPFFGMDMHYHFRLTPPGEALALFIRATDKTGTMLTASFSGKRAPLTDTSLLRAVLGHPLLALKVVGAIHWEALKLWCKGLRIHPRST